MVLLLLAVFMSEQSLLVDMWGISADDNLTVEFQVASFPGSPLALPKNRKGGLGLFFYFSVGQGESLGTG